MSTLKTRAPGHRRNERLDARDGFWDKPVRLILWPLSPTDIVMARRSLQAFALLMRGAARIAALLMLGLGVAQAQPAGTKPAARATVSAEPNMTTASFGDWVLRCQKLPQSATGRVCEVAQTMQVQGQNAPVAQFAIGRGSNSEPLRATAVVPPSISFPSNVQVALGKDASPLELDWRRCLPGACFADLVVKEDQLKRWRAASENGRLIFKDAAGREIAVPLSFQGLGPALDALARETF